MEALYHEMHVSIKTPENDVEKAIVQAAICRYKLKHSIITGDEPDHILTARFRSLNTASAYMSLVQMALGRSMVTRAKIEAAIIDYRPDRIEQFGPNPLNGDGA